MIPPMIVEAAHEAGWRTHSVIQKTRLLWITIGHGDRTVYIWRDRYRHTQGRAYRGNALAAIFTSQRDIVAYLRSV